MNMRSGTAGAALLVVALACLQVFRCGAFSAAAAQGAPPPSAIKSGYAIAGEMCGTPPLAFPKIRIGMRPGYCAGLVASRDDGLVFPRTIVQVPDTRFFVVADMGGWSPGLGRLLLLDPGAPAGKRV